MYLLLSLACFGSSKPAPADLVVLADRGVAVVGRRIDGVYDDPALAEARVGPSTVVLRADRVTAGFVDAHAHPVGYGRLLSELDLTGAPTLQATLARVREAGGTGWIVGRGWDQNDWTDAPEGGWPTAAHLDGVTGARPARLVRVDGHAIWVNRAALAGAGITAATPDPPGGQIVRDAAGEPTGVLIDTASDLVPAPTPTAASLRGHLVRGLDALVATGLTGVHVMGIDDATLGVMTQLDADGELPMRLWVYVSPETEAAAQLRRGGPWEVDRLKVVGVKVYADGALGSRGALLSAPYADQPGHTGLAIAEAAAIREIAGPLTAQGAQIAIHAIGDLAVRHALDAIEAARRAHPDASVRHRVEHSQVVHPDDVARFAELDTIASVQPTHATSDMPWAEARLGPERIGWAYRWRSLADAGATLAFGSDAPVEDPAPAGGLWAATRRTDAAGNPAGGWRIEEAVSLDEAIAAFTVGAATAVGEEDRLGSLREGQRADLTLWTTGERWEPAATVVDGQIGWRATGDTPQR